ncbi:MAG TPA: TonB-dependent receptor [Candidatus Dormibacteraeota bacterium]|jgi:vitamin B12 transporter|nr:TonB-dependent receptor [Candidatus Dormibacteraeota bacterium]
MKLYVSCFLRFLLAVSFSNSCLAQNNLPDAHLSGVILDMSGSGVGGVHVSAALDDQPQGNVWKATSTTDGAFALALPPGKYHIVFAKNSFATREFDFELAGGETKKLDFRMELEQLSASVVVTAQSEPLQIQRTTAPVDIITKEEIDQRKAVSLADALLYSPGITIGRTGAEGGSTSIFLNGGESRFTKLLVDGAPVNPIGNAVDFSYLSYENIDKVEIVRGAESAIYGTDAVSGVIQIFTHRGTTRTPSVNLYAEGGTFSTGNGGADIGGLLGKFDYSAAGSYFSTGGPDVDNRFINRTASGNFGYSFSDSNQLRVTVRNNGSNAGTPGQTLITPPNSDAHTDYENFSANARWDFALGKHWHYQISGSEAYNRRISENPTQSFFATDPAVGCPQDPASPNSVPTPEFCDFPGNSSAKQNRANVAAQASFLLSNFAATTGYQYEVENAFLSTIQIDHARRNNQGGFLDFRYSPHPRLTLSFGGRAEANGNFGTRFVPRVGASMALLQGRGFWGETRLRLYYGEGIKEPGFDQTIGFDICDPGNPTLKPESSKSWSAGIEQKIADDRVSFSGQYFYNRFYDLVSFTSCSSFAPCNVPIPSGCGSPFWGSFFNTDKARARGVNVTAEVKTAKWLKLVGTYTYDDTRVIEADNAFDPTQTAGNRLLRRPVHSGSATLFANYRSLVFTLAGYFSGERTDSDFLFLGFTRNPGYARFDLATAYNFGRGISGYVRVQNLFDKQYQDALGFPALGREARVGINYRFGGKS